MTEQRMRDDVAYQKWRESRVTPDVYSAWHGGIAHGRAELKTLESFLADLFSRMRTPGFFGMEVSEDVCLILQRHGFVEFVPYDPELHGEIDCAEPGDNVWVFTDAMKRIADMKAE